MKTVGTPKYREAMRASRAIKKARNKRRAISKWVTSARNMLGG